MLNKLSKLDKYWRKFAYSICKDKMLADDIVQDMYIYFSDKDKQFNKHYICRKLFGLFIDHQKKVNKPVSLELFHYLKDESETFEADDKQLYKLEQFNNLTWREKELIIEYHVNEKSYRQIEKEFPMTNYQYIFRTVRDGLNKIK